jgi:hypothetical protein
MASTWRGARWRGRLLQQHDTAAHHCGAGRCRAGQHLLTACGNVHNLTIHCHSAHVTHHCRRLISKDFYKISLQHREHANTSKIRRFDTNSDDSMFTHRQVVCDDEPVELAILVVVTGGTELSAHKTNNLLEQK